MGRRASILQESEHWRGSRKMDYALANGSRMGICLPGGDDDDFLLRRHDGRPGPCWVVLGELQKHDTSRWQERTEHLRALRHARQRMAMVSGLVRARLLRKVSC